MKHKHKQEIILTLNACNRTHTDTCLFTRSFRVANCDTHWCLNDHSIVMFTSVISDLFTMFYFDMLLP